MEEDRPSDMVKEKIRFNTEILRLCVVGILTVGGGTVSLIEQDGFSGKRSFMIAIGLILLIALTTCSYHALKMINKSIK
jgi:hypothetical protein